MRLPFKTILFVWFQAQSSIILRRNRFFEVPSRFCVWYTSPPSSLQYVAFVGMSPTGSLVSDKAFTILYVQYCQHIVLFLAQTPSFRICYRHGLSFWGAKVALEVIAISVRYRFKLNVRHHFWTPTSYIGLRFVLNLTAHLHRHISLLNGCLWFP